MVSGTMPLCPTCGEAVRVIQILGRGAFECRGCQRKLFVSEKYKKRLSQVCIALGLAVALPYALHFLATEHQSFLKYLELVASIWLISFGVGLVLMIPVNLIALRLMPPDVEDYETYSNGAHYLDLS
jgi:uncharacterized paraquat-inducible protein A